MKKAKTFDGQTAKMLAVIGENMPDLSGEEMQYWIQNPESLQVYLKGLYVSKRTQDSQIWKTISLGTDLESLDEYSGALEEGGFRVDERGEKLLQAAFGNIRSRVRGDGYTGCSSESYTAIDLVLVTTAQLGFNEGARLSDISERAKKIGWELCPPEVGPQLRLQYEDQQKNGPHYLYVAMQPIYYNSGMSCDIFYLGCDNNGPWLSGQDGHPNMFYHEDNHWVFVRPRK